MQIEQIIKEISKITKRSEREVEEALRRLSKRAEVPFEDTVKLYYQLVKR